MKILFTLSIMLFFTGCTAKTVNNTERPESVEPLAPAEGVMPEISHIPDKTESQKGKELSINQVVETACGQCQFGMTKEPGCDLAVRIAGKAYFVDGTNIDDHGDAHADDGFCEAIRRASVKGKIIEGRFKSESFTLIE